MNEEMKMRMNLQYFAEQDSGDGENQNQDAESLNEQNGHDSGEQGREKQTDPEIDRQISIAVEKALTKARQKFEEEKSEAIEKARKDAEDYAKMSEKEKWEKQLSDREKAIAKKEEEIRIGKLRNDVAVDLREDGLPESMASVLVLLDDVEEIREVMKDLKQSFDSAVNEAVVGRLDQKEPTDANGIRLGGSERQSLADFARKQRIVKE